MASPLFDPVSVALVGSGAVQRLAVVDGCTSPVNFLAEAAKLKIIAGKGAWAAASAVIACAAFLLNFQRKLPRTTTLLAKVSIWMMLKVLVRAF
jgi:hypothetical protein